VRRVEDWVPTTRPGAATRLGRPLRVAVLCSYRAPGLVQLLNHDRRRGRDYDVVCCLTSSDTFLEEVRVERRGVPCLSHSIRRFCHERGVSIQDGEARTAYDAESVRRLGPFGPDIVLLDGYLLRLSRPMLDAFDGRIVNVHHSDLTLRSPDGSVRYPGLRAVRDALLAGEPDTCASAHLVTEGIDEGPVILRSWRFPAGPEVARLRERRLPGELRAAIREHEERMLREAWAPMMMAAIALAAEAMADLRRPLDAGRIGCWVLDRSGTLSRDARAECERAAPATVGAR
jgi:folate-dependent phosphoribosylglycinamide formyltransferase PurN